MMASILAGPISQTFQHNSFSDGQLSANPTMQDPLSGPGATSAFNYTYGTADIYTNATALQIPSPTGTQLLWFSTINSTSTTSPIPGTAFNFTASSPVSAGHQDVNWTLTIPKTSCSTCSVYVQFTLFGNLTKGTSENFTLTLTYNNTLIPTTICSGSPQGSCSFLGNSASSVLVCGTTTSPLLCPTSNPVQVNATRWVGYKIGLSFRFGWNATGAEMKASVGEVRVASIDNTVKPSISHFISQNSTDIISHRAVLAQISYNATVEHPANGTSTMASHVWANEVINILYPSGYNITRVVINSTSSGTTTFYQSGLSVPVPFEKTSCQNIPCSQSLLAINMMNATNGNPTFIHNSNVTITAVTHNSIAQIATLSGGLPTQLFTSGDQISIKVVNKPSIVNASTSLQTGTLSLTFPSALSILTGPVSTATGGVYNFTLPSDCGPNNQLCSTDWGFSAVFISLYDLGNATGSFRINSLQVSFTGSTGGSNALSVQGRLTYGDGTGASGINATLFAVDRGLQVNRPVTNNQTKTSSSLLYISNVTLVNGVFTQGQSLIMLFTVVNPNATQLYNANVTIEHEWAGPLSHNMSVTFSLHPGDPLSDLPFNNTASQTYKATILFTGTGVQVTLSNLRTSPNHFPTVTMTEGTSPVVPNRPHAGLFNITLTSMIGSTTEAPISFLPSPLYAYVGSSLVPSRYLSGSDVIRTGPNGDFSATISSDFLLGAKNMTVFLLARAATGIGLVNNLSTIALTDSTILLATTDPIGTVARDETVSATLHLKSDSTKISEVITVNLILQDNGMSRQVATTGVTILPGDSQTVTLTFPAPSTIGSYTLTFSSPEYGGPLTSQTLHVAILQSNLQILIPAAIGVVAAIIVLGVYLIRGKPVKEAEEKTKTKPAAGSTKTRPAPANPPSKSLTRTRGTEE